MQHLICFLGLLLTVLSASAQAPVYQHSLPAEPPYFRLRFAGSEQAGELVFPVSYSLWVPPGVKTLRGVVVHQHGCGEGSCKSGLTGAHDLHWQALAAAHDCALLSPAYEQPDKANCQLWCDPRNGSDKAFLKALKELGRMSGHPELAEVPWALWGHSGGGHWVGGMALLHPDRVAAAWLRSGVPNVGAADERAAPYTVSDTALRVPLLCNLGTKEGFSETTGRFAGVWSRVQSYVQTLRAKGAPVGVAVDPLTAHECGNQRYLAIRWLHTCLKARLPHEPGKPLRPMPAGYLTALPQPGALVQEPVSAEKYAGEKSQAIWLPDAAMAQAWLAYVKDTALPDTTPPPAPRKVVVQGQNISWEAVADLESGTGAFIIERDGQVLATLSDKKKNPYGRPLFQGLQYSDTPVMPLVPMSYTDSSAVAGQQHKYRVIAVNTVGLRSE